MTRDVRERAVGAQKKSLRRRRGHLGGLQPGPEVLAYREEVHGGEGRYLGPAGGAAPEMVEDEPPSRGTCPPKVRGSGQFGAEVPGSGPIWRWGPGVPAVSIFSSVCGVSIPFCLPTCWCVVTN